VSVKRTPFGARENRVDVDGMPLIAAASESDLDVVGGGSVEGLMAFPQLETSGPEASPTSRRNDCHTTPTSTLGLIDTLRLDLQNVRIDLSVEQTLIPTMPRSRHDRDIAPCSRVEVGWIPVAAQRSAPPWIEVAVYEEGFGGDVPSLVDCVE
jgi:hypothetical protein